MVIMEEGYCFKCDDFYTVELDEYGIGTCPVCGEELDMVDF
jgi:Zn finger protein HypA/HybF involved in hydrogenase expression